MRMDRYDDEEINGVKQTRTNKNQELYTDVYLNNAYVDISDLKEVLDEKPEEIKEDVKNETPETITYTYVEKKYDINELIKKAIAGQENNNITRNVDYDESIDSIIESINENQKEKEKDDNLLGDLLPDSNNTTVVMPLDKPILDTSLIDTSELHRDDMSDELLDIETEPKKKEIKQDDNEIDESFKNETKVNKKLIFIIVGIILLIIIVLGILIWKKVIKF